MDKDTKVDDKGNNKLAAFAEELKALLEKHNVSIEVKSEIVAVDLDKVKKPEDATPVSLDAK